MDFHREFNYRQMTTTERVKPDLITIDIVMEALSRMMLIRYTEAAISEDFRENKIFSFYHSSMGQEAVAVGACLPLSKDDKVFGNHRSHGHYLAKGGDLYRMLAEIYGHTDGCCSGFGGSMHMLDRSVGFDGTTPILGSIIPIALGCAFAQKQRKDKAITVVFLGDGASEEGAFYESLNLCVLLRLPILFVLEDNLYAVNTPANARRSAYFKWEQLVTSFGVTYKKVNGNHFEDVYNYVSTLHPYCMQGYPTLIHAIAFRHMAHSGPIKDESVRITDSEIIREQEDPIRHVLTDWLGHMSTGRIDGLSQDVKDQVNRAFEKLGRSVRCR